MDMSNAVTISGSSYTIVGTVINKKNNLGVLNLQVLAYDKDSTSKDDFLGIANTDSSGTFSIKFDSSKFEWLLDRSPDLYFIVNDAGLELLNTKSNYIKNATMATPAINLEVDLSDDTLRQSINQIIWPILTNCNVNKKCFGLSLAGNQNLTKQILNAVIKCLHQIFLD